MWQFKIVDSVNNKKLKQSNNTKRMLKKLLRNITMKTKASAKSKLKL